MTIVLMGLYRFMEKKLKKKFKLQNRIEPSDENTVLTSSKKLLVLVFLEFVELILSWNKFLKSIFYISFNIFIRNMHEFEELMMIQFQDLFLAVV